MSRYENKTTGVMNTRYSDPQPQPDLGCSASKQLTLADILEQEVRLREQASSLYSTVVRISARISATGPEGYGSDCEAVKSNGLLQDINNLQYDVGNILTETQIVLNRLAYLLDAE